jgi:Leucine-rich repeat (LRR) protein
LKFLKLDKNRLSEQVLFPNGPLSSMGNLKLLDLSYNTIMNNIPVNSFASMKNLERLHLRGNGISYLANGTCSGLNNLHHLDLSFNHFTKVPHGCIMSTQSLLKLILSSNKLRSLADGAFSNLQSLQSLDISHCHIDNISTQAFAGIHYLEELDISDNMIGHVPSKAFQHLIALKYIDLSRNCFTVIYPYAFQNLFNLEVLLLDDIKGLEEIRKWAFQGLTRLTKLQINDNSKLQYIHPHACANLTSLQSFSLQNNDISSLAKDTLQWHQLQYIYLTGNNWACDCQLEWLTILLSQLGKQLSGKIICMSPPNVAGEDIMDVTSFPCTSASSLPDTWTIITLLSMLATLIALMFAVFFRLRENNHRLSYRSEMRHY